MDLADHWLRHIRSNVEYMTWPPVMQGAAGALLGLLHQLEDSQWLSPQTLMQHQYAQLATLASYANQHAPHFHFRLKQASMRPEDLATPEGLLRLPVLTRRDIQKTGPELYSKAVPHHHMPLSEIKTSGSTGEPLLVKKTAVSQLFWMAMTLREHFWHQRDFSQRFFMVKANVPQPVMQNDWGIPVSLL